MHLYPSRELISIVRGSAWPFSLVLQVGDERCTYTSQSDFLVTKNLLPRLLIEVNSTPPKSPPSDLYRMLAQGASVVRFANTFVNAYSGDNKFTLVAVFIRPSGIAERYLLFQSQSHSQSPSSTSTTSTNKVCINALYQTCKTCGLNLTRFITRGKILNSLTRFNAFSLHSSYIIWLLRWSTRRRTTR